MRADRKWRLALGTSVVVLSTSLSAHRLDEYLQAARIAIEPDRVELQLDLTPGVAVADAIVADIDRDSDGTLSADEKRAYVERVLGAIELRLDGQLLHVSPATSAFPDLDAFRQGGGTIRLQSAALLPPDRRGNHQLVFRNANRPDVSAYLANALVPESERFVVTAQKRDVLQRNLTIDFVEPTPSATFTGLWLLGGLASVAMLIVLRTRPSIGHWV